MHYYIYFFFLISPEYFPGAASRKAKSKLIQNPNDGFGINYVTSTDNSLSAHDRRGKVKWSFKKKRESTLVLQEECCCPWNQSKKIY